jgi:hypothetical protein
MYFKCCSGLIKALTYMLEDTFLQTLLFGLLYQFTLIEIFVNMFCNLVITDFYSHLMILDQFISGFRWMVLSATLWL